MNQLEDFLMPTQKELYSTLCKMFGRKVISQKGSFILIQGEAPIMLVAHLDTVHKERVKQICKTQNGNILMSPQGIGGDDRCGVYALVTAHKLCRIKPWLLFTCDEEVGGVGAGAFCKAHQKGNLPKALKGLKCLVEIDRKGKDDAVYYDCANDEFEAYITSKGFKTDYGSYSDISDIAPELGIAAVNLSSGYYNAHTLHEYIDRKQLNATVKRVVGIVDDSTKPDFPTYEYIEAVYDRFGLGYGRYGGWYDGYNNWDDDFEEPDLMSIPEDIRGPYVELLDFYSPYELEGYRAEFGDSCIPMLYESEFGVPYGSLDDEDESWEKQNK